MARHRIAVICASIHSGAARHVVAGLMAKAEAMNVALFVLPGGRLFSSDSGERARNLIFDHLDYIRPDGVVSWASSLGGYATVEDLERFHARLRGTPCVTLNQVIGDLPVVMLDGYRGMREAVTHLVRTHGRKKLAFIRGPLHHPSAHQRFQAYQDALRSLGLRVDERIVSSPSAWDRGLDAITELVDTRGLEPARDFDAIVAASDLLAFDVMAFLQSRGCRVPHDIAVVGCNDSAEARITIPPLTTVAMPFFDQGAEALERLIDIIENRAPALHPLPVSLLVRQSCGCPSTEREIASRFRIGPDTLAEDCTTELRHAVSLTDDRFASSIEPLVSILNPELPSACEAFQAAFERALEDTIRNNENPGYWHNVIAILSRRLADFPDRTERSRRQRVLETSRLLVAEAAARSEAYRHWENEKRSEQMRELVRGILDCMHLGELAVLLKTQLRGIGIESLFLCTREKSASLRLRLALVDGVAAELPNYGVVLKSGVSPVDLHAPSRLTWVVLPLFVRDEGFGVLYCAWGAAEPKMYEELRSCISSAVKNSLLLSGAREIVARSEEVERARRLLISGLVDRMRKENLSTATRDALGQLESAGRAPVGERGIAEAGTTSGACEILFVGLEHGAAAAEGLNASLPGITGQLCAHGEEALAILEYEKPLLIVVAQRLKGMDGVSFLGELRNSSRATPALLFFDAAPSERQIETCIALGNVLAQVWGPWGVDEMVRLCKAMREKPGRLVQSPAVLRCLAQLALHFSTRQRRWRLADSVNMSEDHLSRLFRSQMYLSPWEYLKRYRVHQARKLLGGSGESVAEVASRVGYDDAAYFSRVFRSCTGTTPQAFRESSESRIMSELSYKWPEIS